MDLTTMAWAGICPSYTPWFLKAIQSYLLVKNGGGAVSRNQSGSCSLFE